jgi:tRNA(Ile)-lysidine synthase TilS/MesJ
MTTRNDESRDLTRILTRKMGRAIQDYGMIQEGDRIMVAVSGGKDSYALLDLLERLRRRSPVRFELVAANVDQGYNGFRSDVIEDHLKAGGYHYHIEMTEIATTHTARFARGCAAACCIASPPSSAATRSPWDTTPTTSSRRS